MEFNYDLFYDAKDAANDATLKMTQISTFVTKAKAIPLPSILNTAGIYTVLDQVLTVKDNAVDINSMLGDWSAAIDEAYRIQSEEEYNRLMGEYAIAQQDLDEYMARTYTRVTEEEGKAIALEGRKLTDARNAIDNRMKELETILGITRPNEYQWWDDLVAVSKDINSDLKDLAGDYGDMFRSIGTDAFSDNFDNVVQGTIEIDEKIDATTAQIGSDISRGVGNLVEKAADFTMQAASWLVLNTGTTGIVFTVADLLGSDIKTTVENWTQSVVETDFVDSLYNDFYTKTEHGKEISDLSYIKYDSTIANAINTGTQSVVETGVAVGLSILATPAAGAAFIGLVKGGEAVNKAYDNGATFNEATGYGAIEAAVNGGMWYILGKSGEGIKALTSSAAMFGKDASLKLLGTYALRNAGTVGVKPFIDALAEKVTYNSETSLGDILEQNNTLTQSLTGMSMAGLLTYVPGYFMIDKATTSLAAVETLGLPAATGATEATTYTTLYNPEVAVETVGAISAGSPELGLSVISNNGIANLTGGLVTTIPSYIPTSLPAVLSGSMDALPKVISNIDGLLEPVGSTIGSINPTGLQPTIEVPVYKDYSKLTSNVGLETKDSPYLKLVNSDPLTPIKLEGAEVVYYDKLTETIKLEAPGDLGVIQEPTAEPITAQTQPTSIEPSNQKPVLENETSPNGLLNMYDLPESTDSSIGSILDKMKTGEPLTLGERIKVGRDEVYTKLDGYELKPDCAYRAVSPEAIEVYKKSGYITGFGDNDEFILGENNLGVDWYLGGAAPKYGEVIIELPANPDYFTLTSNNGLGMANNPYVRFIKSSGTLNPVPLNGAKLIYYDKLTGKIDKIETVSNGTIVEPITAPTNPEPIYTPEYNDKMETIREELFNLDETSSLGEFPHYKTDLERVVNSSLELEARIEISGNKIKVYDIDIPPNVREEEYLKILHEFTDREISEGASLDSLISSKTAEYQSKIDALKKVGGELEIEPYYGQKSYITGRIEYIKDCLGNLLKDKNFSGRTDIPEYISEIDTILQKYGDTSIGTFEQQKTMYDSLVEDYKKVLRIEDTLSKDVEKIWESALTPTDSYSKTGDFGFLAHSLTGGKFNPADMNKLCTTYITQDSITIPYGNFGLIYPMSMQNIIAMSTEDAGSWVISKEEFVKRGFVKSWQYTDAIDDKGNRMFYEIPQNSKLILPGFMEQQTIANTVAQNGNVLNYDNFVSYNEIILTNLTKDVLPTGVFVSINPDGKDYSTIIKEAKAYAEELGVPYIEIDVAARRELNRLKTAGISEPLEYNAVDNGVISEMSDKGIMTGTIPETLVGSGPIIDVTPEVMLKKIEDFFALDMEVKDILNAGVPIDTGQLIDPDGFLLAQQDSLLKVSKTLERKLMSISRNFEFGSEIDTIIREKFKEFEIEILNCDGGYLDLKKVYENYYTIIRPSFRDLVKNEVSGYGGHGTFSGHLDVLLNETVSVDEMLHVIHAYICSNEEYLQLTPIIAQKTTDMGYPVNLYGKDNEIAKGIYNAISLDSEVGTTDIVALDDKVLMMVRDLGHALSIEIEVRPTDVYVKYHIPKICNVEKVNALPGVTKVPLDTPATSSTNGYFHSTKENISKDIEEFLNNVPTDSDIVYDPSSYNYNPKTELIDEKSVLDYFCGPDCGEYYTDTDPNHSINWSHNFFLNDITRGFFDGDNSYEFAYQKVASKLTDPKMVEKFYKFLDETKLGTYFKTLTCSEWEAVLNYTGGISKSINIPLLEGNKTTEFIQKTISELDSAISKFNLKTDITTYSGQSPQKFASFGIESIEELSQLEGCLMMDKSFVSSSTILDGAKDLPIIMEIETPAGSNCAYLGIVSSNPSENEILYGRNTVFQINSVEYRMNSNGEKIAYMYMKVMN